MTAAVPTKPRRRRNIAPWVAGGLTLFVLVAFLLFPIGTTLLNSFAPSGERFAFGNATFENFTRFWTSAQYQTALINTIIIGLAVTVLSTIVAVPAAYFVARVQMPFKPLIMSLSIIPLISPPFVGAYSWVILFGRSGIVSQYLRDWFGFQMPPIYGFFGVILAMVLANFTYVFLFVQGALTAVDPHLEESARVMGASRWRILRTVVLPLAIPPMLAGAMIVLIEALGEFGIPAVLGGEVYVLSTLMYFQIHGYFNLNAASAIALVNVAITLIAIVLLLRINRKRRFITVGSTTRRAALQTGRGIRIVANLYVWGLLAVALLPQAVVIFTSFAEKWPGTRWPLEYGLDNYRYIFSRIVEPMQNSLMLAAIATVVCVIFGTLTGYIAERKTFPGKWALDLTIMLPFVLPGIVTGVALLVTYNSGPIALTGTAAILVIAYFVRRIAYIYRSVVAAVSQLDLKMEEASTIAGAGWSTTMRKITVPLIAPGILAGAIIVFTTLISEMSTTIMLYSARWKTVSIAIYERLESQEIAAAAAIGSVTILVTLLLVLTATRVIGKSMSELFS
ncbi:ABC transporter permease [Frigidibacter sp. ROC022]|uniref:ABC transporter permease n=1 Tax=Frigidibacter sp. ROC022 TaxID=2971796 RepID=UPI00215ADDF0|nr:iron ABC transporter permease [Frigidibacter sp. ROC022]MCR8725093.1 iron ABC transporter permease [Frigidibacter sp. ROC022]